MQHKWRLGAMLIVKEKVKVSDGIVQMKLPEEYRDKTVEVIIRIESEIEKKLLSDTIKIDTLSWKFRREEIYDR
jgi:hypothetical protein